MATESAPTVIIAPVIGNNQPNPSPDAVYVFEQWSDVQVNVDMEFTTKPTQSGSSMTLVRRVMPRIAMAQVIVADVRTDEEKAVEGAATTLAHLKARVDAVVALRGSMVHFTSRTISFPGALASVKVNDTGEWDNMVTLTLEVREIIEADAKSLQFGNIRGLIRVPFTPKANDPVGGNGGTCNNYGYKRKFNGGNWAAKVAGTALGITLSPFSVFTNNPFKRNPNSPFVNPGAALSYPSKRAYWRGVGKSFVKIGKGVATGIGVGAIAVVDPSSVRRNGGKSTIKQYTKFGRALIGKKGWGKLSDVIGLTKQKYVAVGCKT